MTQASVLIIEDDKAIMNFMRVSLKARDYICMEAHTGKDGLALFTSNKPDVVLLDLGLPDMEGVDVLKEIRSFSQLPVIVVTARGQETEKAETLDMGADDYLCKPFSIIELMARIRVALRHSKTAENKKAESLIQIGDLRFDSEKRKVTLDDKEIHLTPNEYKILGVLVRNAGKVLTYNYLAKELWGVAMEKDTNSLRVFMTGIRHKIEADPSHPRYIKTEIGVGYRFAEN